MREVTVPLLDLKLQYATIKTEVDEAIRRVVDSQRFILGPEVSELEREIAGYCGCAHAVSCASGTDAILLALMVLGVGAGDQVICPAHTFFATAGSIARLGAVPVFVDIDPVTYNMDPHRVRTVAQRCTRLRAIMPVHLFGQSADMEAFVGLGEEFGVPIIEDAAQALGSRDQQGQPAGTLGAVGCFSFYPTKNLGGFGDGGIITTSDAGLAERLAVLRAHGARNKYEHDEVGLNSKLDALHAAVLRVKLRHLDAWSDARRANAAVYDRAFAAAGGGTSALPADDADLPVQTPHPPVAPAMHIYNQYVIRVPAAIRDALREHLRQRRVGTEIYYPVPLHLQVCFRSLGYAEGDLPQSEAAAAQTLVLPIFPELTREQLEHVAGTVIEFVSQAAVAAGQRPKAKAKAKAVERG